MNLLVLSLRPPRPNRRHTLHAVALLHPWPASLLRGAAERSCAGPTPACLPRPSCPSVRGADVIRARRSTHHPSGRLNLHPEGAGDSTSRSCRAAGRRILGRAAAVGDLNRRARRADGSHAVCDAIFVQEASVPHCVCMYCTQADDPEISLDRHSISMFVVTSDFTRQSSLPTLERHSSLIQLLHQKY